MPEPRFSKEEFSRRGQELYESIRPQVEPGHRGEVVAIDIETGEYEVAPDTVTAATQLRTRHPDAQTWFVRIGHEVLYRFGARTLPEPT